MRRDGPMRAMPHPCIAPCVQFADAAASAAMALSTSDRWKATERMPPSEWDTMQTILWIDSIDVSYDPKAVISGKQVPGGLNGSTLISLVESGRLAAIGVTRRIDQARLQSQLRRRLHHGTALEKPLWEGDLPLAGSGGQGAWHKASSIQETPSARDLMR
mmetsp:Transcript_43644/g.98649  ORF Transcript_43644/g.98649 Transcript_43644/m.98649 type:complete len:160 (-) Transcript_43644:13-492(-)